MFTLWNSCSACLAAKSDCIGGDRLDLLNRGHVIPPGREVHHQSRGFAPWNFGSACLGGRNDRISMECLNLIHQGGVIPLGFTLWNVRHISLGSYQLWTDHKDPVSQNESGVFAL